MDVPKVNKKSIFKTTSPILKGDNLSCGQAQIMLEQINGNWNVGALEYPFGRGRLVLTRRGAESHTCRPANP